MSENEMLDAARKRPFEPFRLHLTTGELIDVRHPEMIMVGKRSVIVGLSRDPADVSYERTLKVDLLHIVAVEELPSVRPGGNGDPAR